MATTVDESTPNSELSEPQMLRDNDDDVASIVIAGDDGNTTDGGRARDISSIVSIS